MFGYVPVSGFRRKIIAAAALILASPVTFALQYKVPATCFTAGQFPDAPATAYSFEYRESATKRAHVSVWQQRCDLPNTQAVTLMRVAPLEGVPNVSASAFRFDQSDAFPGTTGFYSSPGALLGASAVSVDKPSVHLIGAKAERDAQNQFVYEFVPDSAFTLTVNMPTGDRVAHAFSALEQVTPPPSLTADDRVLGLLDGVSAGEQTELLFMNSGSNTVEVRGRFLDPNGRETGQRDGVLIPLLRAGQTVRMTLSEATRKLDAAPWSGYGSFKLALPTTGITVQVLRTGGVAGAIGNLSCVSTIAAPVVPGRSNVDKAEVVVYNLADRSAEIFVTVFHEDGHVLGQRSVLLDTLPAGGSRVYGPDKLASTVGVSDWSRRARVEFSSVQGRLRVLNLLRPEGRAVTNVSCPSRDGLYNITGPSNVDQTYLRFINTTESPRKVAVTLYSQDGAQLSGKDAVLDAALPGKSSLVLSSTDLRNRLSLASWDKRAWLDLSASSPGVEALALIRTPANVLMDNSCARTTDAHLVSPVGSAETTFVRVTNTTEKSLQINAELRGADGERAGGREAVLVPSLSAKSTAVFSSLQLSQIFGGSWGAPGLLRLPTYPGIKVLSMNRSREDVLSNVSCAASIQGAGFTSWLGNEVVYNSGVIKAGSRVGIHVANNTATSFQVEAFILLNGGQPVVVEDIFGTVLSGSGSYGKYHTFIADTPHSGLDLLLRLRAKDSGTVHDVTVTLPKP